MTKEEFERTFSDKLESLYSKREKLKARLDYIKKIDPYGYSDQEQIKKELDSINKEISLIQNLIYLPIYERIMASSDEEIAAYKEERKKDIDLKISSVEAKISLIQKEIENLNSKEEENIEKFSKADNKQQEAALLEEGKKIISERIQKEEEIEKLNKELEDRKKTKEIFDSKTPSELKEEMAAGINNEHSSQIFVMNNTVQGIKANENDSTTKLLASLNGNQEKIDALKQALNRLLTFRKSGSSKVDFPLYYISQLKIAGQIEKEWYYDGFKVHSKKNLDDILEKLEKYEKEVLEQKELFDKEFTEEKLKPIYDLEEKSRREQEDTVDLVYLRSNIDKLGSAGEAELSDLISLINQKEALEKKRFKTRSVKEDIEILKEEIKKQEDKLYRKIYAWYESTRASKMPELVSSLDSPSYNLERFIKNAQEKANEKLESISKFKQHVLETKAKADKRDIEREETRKRIIADILAIVGPEFKEEDIPYFSDENGINDLDSLVKYASLKLETGKAITEIKQEAQRQADAKEAEIKGITVEQLLELRKQAEAAKASQQATAVETPVVPNNNPGGLSM